MSQFDYHSAPDEQRTRRRNRIGGLLAITAVVAVVIVVVVVVVVAVPASGNSAAPTATRARKNKNPPVEEEPSCSSTFSTWSAWTCHGQYQSRNRVETSGNCCADCTWTPIGPSGDCSNCILHESEPCAGTECQYNAWGAWGSCSTTCGLGTKTRTRTVSQPASGSFPPCSEFSETTDCLLASCTTCQFSDWSPWTCTDLGVLQTRSRDLLSGGCCEGCTQTGVGPVGTCDLCSLFETADCEGQNCEYSAWSQYGPCSVTCGEGTKTRTRTISQPSSGNGQPCDQSLTSTTTCLDASCGVCSYSQWSSWSSCSANCGGGTQTRTRSLTSGDCCDECTNTPYGPVGDCSACLRTETQTCNTQKCKGRK